MANQYPGLARGPIDHQSSSVINLIAAGEIDMGSAVILSAAGTEELLPRATESTATADLSIYGIAVGGDTDGIYGDGTAATSDTNKATEAAGEGVVVVTQGRCLARVDGQNQAGNVGVAVGDALVSSNNGVGRLMVHTVSDVDERVIARALQPVTSGDLDIIAVDIQREGEVAA